MNLMDCFNAFQKVTKALKLSANARSLYIAILGEFNSARYPAVLNIPNALLRHLSSINLEGKSDSSFQSARNALQNAGLIKYKKELYQLTPNDALEKLQKRFGKLLETPCNELGDSLETTWKQVGDRLEVSRFISTTSDKEVDNKNYNLKEEKRESAGAYEKISVEVESAKSPCDSQLNLAGSPSNEVMEVWEKCKGAKLDGNQLIDLISLEKALGKEEVKRAMEIASLKNNYSNFPELWYSFFKRELEKQLKENKEGERIGRNDTGRNGGYRRAEGGRIESESWEHQRPAWLDE